MDYKELLLASFQEAVAAADPLKIVAAHLPPPPKGKTLVVGAGKAAASMARAVELAWPASASLEGLVVTRYAHGLPTARVTVVEAGHPVPDDAGEKAAAEIAHRVSTLTEDDLLIALVSGGGSSLLSLPVAGVDMADLKAVTKSLLKSGAPITEMNIVRKHLSRIQGGWLACACRAPVLTLIVSDVTGDDPSAIASGPTCPDPSTYQDALAVLQRYEVVAPASVQRHLESGAAGQVKETPKPGDPLFARVRNHVIATAHQSLEAGAAFFRSRGITPVVLGDTVTGEAAEVAKVYAALVKETRLHQQPFKAPVALISGGECTVTVRGTGRGGRCVEFLASLAVELGDMPGVYAMAADTDGIDGTEDNAGAILTPDTRARAEGKGLSAQKMLANNDGYSYFAALGDLIITGPTRTNVNDYRVILVV
ncbi:glycerate kinase [Lacisediminimonas sp.]|uniref:glycerate kinase type-2 family protein n=1 Tax=Lacisediminimonas sp. TaxID=3060582 RepID=UPI002716DE88|nr:glycerate kinase [Lacisediminimonas sp.]MDO8301580.1 glycerate kinase [Lacisediminimonas sp.]